MTKYQLAPMFFALSDPTRFAVVERLCRGGASVSELQRPFKMATPTFLRHLQILEEAGLVHSEKKGRVRMVALRGKSLVAVEKWAAHLRREAEARLDRLEDYIKTKED